MIKDAALYNLYRQTLAKDCSVNTFGTFLNKATELNGARWTPGGAAESLRWVQERYDTWVEEAADDKEPQAPKKNTTKKKKEKGNSVIKAKTT